MQKICRTCAVEKPILDFWKQPSAKSGYQSECKECARDRNNEWHRHNGDRWHDRNRECTNAGRRRNPKAALLRAIRNRAKKAGLECTLTVDDLVIPEYCPVLGIKLSFGLGWGEGMALEKKDRRASVDRIDNALGYTPNNIVIVSFRANRLKSDATLAELRKLVGFYEQVKGRGAEPPVSGRVRSVELLRAKAVSLPGVLASSEEKAGSLPVGQDGSRGVPVPMPSLRLAWGRVV